MCPLRDLGFLSGEVIAPPTVRSGTLTPRPSRSAQATIEAIAAVGVGMLVEIALAGCQLILVRHARALAICRIGRQSVAQEP